MRAKALFASGLPTPRSGRARRENVQGRHQLLCLVEENGHIVSLPPFLQGLARVLEVPMLLTALHLAMPSVVAAISTASDSRVPAGLARAAGCRRAPFRGAVLDAFQRHTS